jgi:hypothetical protein
MTKYCSNSSYGYNGFTDTLTELLPEDDAAYVNWGSAWCMPSKAQFDELFNSSYTTTTETTQNGVWGRKITSKKNGKSLFLPFAGYRDNTSLSYTVSYGYYWSRTLSTNNPDGGWQQNMTSTYNSARYHGESVRPVRAAQ